MSKKGLIILILICTLVIIVFIGSTSLLSLISSNHKSTQVDKREEEVIPAYVVQESDLPIKEGHDSVIVTKLNNNHILLIDLRYRGYKLINETGEEIKKAYNFKRIALQHVSDDGFIIQYTRLDEVTKTEKIDLSGQVVWSFDGLIANFDGLHMFDYQKESIGHIFFTTNQDFIMKLNQEGDIIWQKGPYSLLNYIGTNSEYYIYVNNDFTRLYQFNESGNIKELSLSNVKRLTSSNEYFYIVTQNAIEQYDYQLNIKYTYTIENWDIKEIYVDENNNLYTLYKPLDSQLYKVIKLDTNGNKVYETILENQNNGLFNFYELKDGYILVSQLELPQENSNEINRKHYYLLNASGELIFNEEVSDKVNVLKMNEQGNFTYSYLENGQHYIKTFNKEGTLLNKYGPYKDLFSNVNLENQLILMYYKTSEKGLLKIDENGNLDTLSVDQYIENSIEPHNFFILAKNFIGYQVNGDLYSYYRLNDDGTIRNQFRNVAPIYNAIIDDEYTYLYNTKLEKYDSNSDLVYSVQIDKAVNKIYLLKNDYMAVLNFGNELLILNEKGEEIERMSINPIGMEFNDHSSVFYYLDNEVLKEFILNLK